MKAKIIEIQNKIETVNTEIEKLTGLAEESKPSDNLSELQNTLHELTEQRNDLLIDEKFGNDNKAQIAETDKIIKATNKEIDNIKESEKFSKEIARRIERKQDELLTLTELHQSEVVELIKLKATEKIEKRDALFSEYLNVLFEVEAMHSLAKTVRQDWGKDISHDFFKNTSLIRALNVGEIITHGQILQHDTKPLIEKIIADLLAKDGIKAIIRSA